MSAPVVPEISVSELQQLLAAGSSTVALLDVREVEEREIAVLPDQLHIPLMLLESRLEECKALQQRYPEIVVYCRSGARSAMAVQFLRAFASIEAKNLKGGIRAWSQEIDPTITLY